MNSKEGLVDETLGSSLSFAGRLHNESLLCDLIQKIDDQLEKEEELHDVKNQSASFSDPRRLFSISSVSALHNPNLL